MWAAISCSSDEVVPTLPDDGDRETWPHLVLVVQQQTRFLSAIV